MLVNYMDHHETAKLKFMWKFMKYNNNNNNNNNNKRPSGLSLRANYRDRTISACQRSLCQPLRIVLRSQHNESLRP
jgi:hypothetical protein